jgi:hypothetical protein
MIGQSIAIYVEKFDVTARLERLKGKREENAIRIMTCADRPRASASLHARARGLSAAEKAREIWPYEEWQTMSTWILHATQFDTIGQVS